jgi:hypothetical protein
MVTISDNACKMIVPACTNFPALRIIAAMLFPFFSN